MKVFLTAIAASCLIAACNTAPEVNEVKPETAADSTSYAIGLQLGKSFKQQFIDIDVNMMGAGIRDAMADKALMTDSVLQKCIMAVQEKAMVKMQAEQAKKSDSMSKAGNDFLAQNKTKPGVVTTASGLQYQILSNGNGPKPTKDDKVRVHYTGTFIDGRVFDSSIQRGQPIEIGVSSVIPGWTEMLQLMPLGTKARIFIPSSLAYGDQGAGQTIPPGSALVFELELLEIVK